MRTCLYLFVRVCWVVSLIKMAVSLSVCLWNDYTEILKGLNGIQNISEVNGFILLRLVCLHACVCRSVKRF